MTLLAEQLDGMYVLDEACRLLGWHLDDRGGCIVVTRPDRRQVFVVDATWADDRCVPALKAFRLAAESRR